MNPFPSDPASLLAAQTRRHFFSRCALGLGGIALASMLNGRRAFGAEANSGLPALPNPMAPRAGHFAPRAKNIIYLFMAGGPSQLELFDYKPKLVELNGQPIPPSLIEGKRFAFMDSSHGTKLLGTRREFRQHGQSGAWVSDLFPHTAKIVDDITLVHSCAADLFNHAPAKLFMNTGSGQFGRPSMGSWITYGLGSESQDLPGFVVLQSGPRGPRGGAVNWGSGFLPTTFQGVPLRGNGDPILNLKNPDGISATRQRQAIDAIRDLNLKRAVETGDAEIHTRIAAYEMASRMQSSAPELIDLRSESEATLKLYGIENDQPSFARNCLLARRLVERGSRFIQLYHANWDSHGGPGENLQSDFEKVCREVDQGQAALVQDLKARGLLKDTLVVWGGEFGRTPMGENRDTTGRNHHIDAFTMWFAGGGTKAGAIVGRTDELGFNPVQDRAHVHDLHATILHLLGLDHKKLTFRFQGRDFRLTDVHGNVLHQLLA
ncbi:MAG: DUF1501 domain-containing protein [Gammaproteobacteria bacterium]|nr:DUF1501 domain-containing protein [Gammaproteobacteria bacterium]